MQGRLEWTVSTRCPVCANATEECGRGDSPELIRQALVDAHGWSRIVPGQPAPSPVAVMKVLREAGSGPITLADARERAAQLLTGGHRGTRVELELLAQRLRDAGVAVEVMPH